MTERTADDWRELNHAWWEERAPLHETSRFYRAGGGGLEDFELAELPRLDGLDVVHLQCHIGTDTVDLASRGARTWGLDFSVNAIAAAGRIAAEAGVAHRAAWVVADVYDAPSALSGQSFDAVYTGKGALCWLPDLARWADVVDHLLRPGGFLYLSEFHPLQDILADDDIRFERDYFPTGGDVYEEAGSYADPDAETVHNVSVDFVHPLSEVVQVLLDRGLVLRFLHEHPITVFARWPWLETAGDGVWRMPTGRPALPLMYSLRVDKPE